MTALKNIARCPTRATNATGPICSRSLLALIMVMSLNVTFAVVSAHRAPAADVQLPSHSFHVPMASYHGYRKAILNASESMTVETNLTADGNGDGLVLLKASGKAHWLSRSVRTHGSLTVDTNGGINYSPLSGSVYNGDKGFVAKLCFFVKYNGDRTHATIQPCFFISNEFLSTEALTQLHGVVDLKGGEPEAFVRELTGKTVVLVERLGSVQIDLAKQVQGEVARPD